MLPVVVLEESETLGSQLAGALSAEGYQVTLLRDPGGIEEHFCRSQAGLLIVGTLADATDGGVIVLRQMRKLSRAPILFLPKASSEALAIEALRLGVNEYLPRPAEVKEIVRIARRLLPIAVTEGAGADCLSRIIGDGAALTRIKELLPKVGQSHCNVLIAGETGTGKELVAESIHALSQRKHRPFLAVNCAAMPDTLIESELFGYERGAFTGAARRTDGHLHAAHEGTLFLDEIGDMSLVAQSKVLRAIETGKVQRLGSREPASIDVRFVAATNQDLDSRVRDGRFRADLYFRVNVARIDLPPLRDRSEDILLLVRHFLQQFGAAAIALSDEVEGLLQSYRWPGNIRELRNIIQATLVCLTSSTIRMQDLPGAFLQSAAGAERPMQVERNRLIAVLQATRWNKSRAAEFMHWSRMTLYRKMARHQINARPPKSADNAKQRPATA